MEAPKLFCLILKSYVGYLFHFDQSNDGNVCDQHRMCFTTKATIPEICWVNYPEFHKICVKQQLLYYHISNISKKIKRTDLYDDMVFKHSLLLFDSCLYNNSKSFLLIGN